MSYRMCDKGVSIKEITRYTDGLSLRWGPKCTVVCHIDSNLHVCSARQSKCVIENGDGDFMPVLRDCATSLERCGIVTVEGQDVIEKLVDMQHQG